ncbi:MAG: ATP-binding cassette domain-containing protein [Polyangiaceae bacterium]
MARLSVQGVSLRVAERVLFTDLRFEIEPGAWLGLVAPSGAGKTELLRALACLRDVDAGELRLDERTPAEVGYPSWRRRVTYLGQRSVMLKGTVRLNLERPFQYQSVGKSFDEALVRQRLERVGLGKAMLDQEARSLSVGEQQRVALVRALGIGPDVLLLDEPTSALDADSVKRVEAWLRELSEAGLAGAIVSHDPAQLERLGARRVVLAESGQVS